MGDDTLLKELLETFQMEAQDHLGSLSTLLVSLENEREQAERTRLVETIFRRMHTLKGAAHAVNLLDIARSCQELEDLLAGLKRGDLALELTLFDRLHADLDALSRRIFGQEDPTGGPDSVAACAIDSSAEPAGALSPAGAAPSIPSTGGGRPGRGSHADDETEPPLPGLTPPRGGESDGLPIRGYGHEAALAQPEPAKTERRTEQDRRATGETVRVPTRILESLLVQAEELVSAKLAASALLEEVSALAASLGARAVERSRALDLAKGALLTPQEAQQPARLSRAVEAFCEQEQSTEVGLRSLESRAARQLRSLRGMVDPLLEDIKKLHLLPFSSLTDPFHKLVRDLGRELSKEAEFVCTGGEIEIDRRILTELREPLLHLVRNMMDHGIEKGTERRWLGKAERGRIAIDIRLQDANRAELCVSDDGCGIDLEKVKKAALRMELVSAEEMERMSEAEALQLIFESGVSTSPLITTLSGRGVGLAIVRESLERLGGHVRVTSSPAQGAQFRLSLPLSYAMMRGLLVEVAGRPCLIPAASVELTARVPTEQVRCVENRETVLLGGEVVSLVSLAKVLEVAERRLHAPEGPQPVVLVSNAERRIAFAVDQVVGVQEILVKPLGSQLARVRNVAGATVLGDGSVVPILNLGDLFRSAVLVAATGQLPVAVQATPRQQLSVLVVEDSITSRTLLKNILEASGYQVRTAIDGADALSLLKTESFDVVVSDVEMPRLDGFGLTAAIRADQRLQALPVVLVTGLESRSDRERGIEVGANAYVVKSSFDQGGLLEVIEKLT